jgi:hypothetical protein
MCKALVSVLLIVRIKFMCCKSNCKGEFKRRDDALENMEALLTMWVEDTRNNIGSN